MKAKNEAGLEAMSVSVDDVEEAITKAREMMKTTGKIPMDVEEGDMYRMINDYAAILKYADEDHTRKRRFMKKVIDAYVRLAGGTEKFRELMHREAEADADRVMDRILGTQYFSPFERKAEVFFEIEIPVGEEDFEAGFSVWQEYSDKEGYI